MKGVNKMEEKKLIKPFTINIGKEENDKKEQKERKLIKPFTIEAAPPVKLYLVLKYYNSNGDNEEDYRDFEFFKGTTQEMYDHLKVEIENSDEFDIMKSRLLVDSPNIQISHKLNIYTFMKDARDTNRIVDESSFNIDDYYYDLEDMEADNNGEE